MANIGGAEFAEALTPDVQVIHIYIHIHTFIHTYIHTNIHTYIHNHTYINIFFRVHVAYFACPGHGACSEEESGPLPFKIIST